ncbi:nudC domain-containing protein 1 [Culicoides brevitarsis]|uniref:nudC domain-containing protein 1 n=1 Tax=Culicoides brevitarsis TaxID=469753 RepID=UPI00307BD1EF
MGPKTVELRPDRSKLRTNFEGYKLNLESIPVLRYELQHTPLRISTTDRQFSFLHAQLFAFHNHLFKDPWHLNTCYFLDSSWTVQKIFYDDETGKVKPVNAVLKLQKPKIVVEDRYPACLVFVSEKFGLFSDGCGSLAIIETGDREKSCEFKVRQMLKPLDNVEGFVISNARFDVLDGVWKISCILTFIRQNKEHFETIAHWMVLNLTENVWKVENSKVLRSRGAFSYCALEHRAGALVVASDYPVDFESKILEREKNRQKPSEKPTENGNESKEDTEMMEKDIHKYTWTQTEEDVTIVFDEQPEATKADYVVQVTRDQISIKCKGNVMLQGQLFEKIDPDTTTWSINNRNLEVILNKADSVALKWPFLVPGSPADSCEANSDPNPVVQFANQMEECDLDINEIDKENYLSRLSWNTEEITHKVYLGSHGPLFDVNLRPGLPNAVALKHDVDACVWLQMHNNTKTTEWTMSHEATIDAFSYVLASKQQKKFVGCAPNANYVVIAEPERHVFIYKQTYDGSNLRNRTTGASVNIGQQKLVTLENTGEVIGMSVENDVTLLLTTQFILCIQLKIEE